MCALNNGSNQQQESDGPQGCCKSAQGRPAGWTRGSESLAPSLGWNWTCCRQWWTKEYSANRMISWREKNFYSFCDDIPNTSNQLNQGGTWPPPQPQYISMWGEKGMCIHRSMETVQYTLNFSKLSLVISEVFNPLGLQNEFPCPVGMYRKSDLIWKLSLIFFFTKKAWVDFHALSTHTIIHCWTFILKTLLGLLHDYWLISLRKLVPSYLSIRSEVS